MRLEPYVDAAIAALQAGMAARVDALNATTSDFDVSAPVAYYYGVQHEIWAYPAVEVAAPDADLVGLSIEQVDGTISPVVMVMVWNQDTDRVRLWRSIDRIAHCVWDVLMQPGAFGQGVIVDRVSQRLRVNPETRDAAEVTAGCLQVYALEDVARRHV